MTTFIIQALPCSHYSVMSNGEKITMVSVAYGAAPIVRTALENANLAWLRHAFASAYQEAIKSGKSFSMRVQVIGKKPRGYDAASHEFRKDHIVEECAA